MAASYHDFEPYYTEAERLYHVHGQRGSDPTEPPCDDPYPYPAVSHEPRIQQLADDLEARRPPPVPAAGRHHARRGQAAGQRLHPLRHLRRVSVPGAGQGRRACRLRRRRPCGTRTSRLLTDAYVERLETSATGREVVGGGRASRRRASSAIAATSSSSPAARSIRRRCCCARPTGASGRARQRLRRRRPSLHVPHQLGADRDLAHAEPDPLPEDARAQRFLFRQPTITSFRSGTSRCSARPMRRCSRARRTICCPGFAAESWRATRSISG